MRRFLLSVIVAAWSGGAGPAAAQGDDLMTREIDDALAASRWRAGPFRLTPILRIGAGTDSNPLGQPGTETTDDVTAAVGPGIRAVLPMGNRGLIELNQENGYVYFRDLENLRNFYNISDMSAAIGGRDFVAKARGGYRTGQVRPTSELDVPLEQTQRRYGGEVDIALGSTQQLNVIYDSVRFRHHDPEADIGVPVESLLDRTEESYRAQFERYISPTASLIVEGTYNVIDYVDSSTLRNGTGIGGMAGIVFSPRGRVRGQAMFGYDQLTPEFDSQAAFSGLVASADVIYPLGDKLRLRGLYARDTRPSILPGNWFFVENRFGGSLDVYLADRWFVRAGATVGRNSYPRPTTFTDEEGNTVTAKVQDDFNIYTFSVNYELTLDLIVRGGIDIQQRSSNLPQFNKDRNVVTIGLTTLF